MLALLSTFAFVALLVWLFGGAGRRPTPAPEDDVTTPIDREALAEAERELHEDGGARPIGDAIEEDDWGPGTGGKGGLPGFF
jgi:hypothetical protein